MSPRTTFLLTLAGVLLVGLPLLQLTQVNRQPATAQPQEEQATQRVYTTCRFTGAPQQLILRYGAAEWQIDTSSAVSEIEMEFPHHSHIEIEVKAQWPDEAAQAVTLTLEPDGLESRSVTQWKEEGSQELHCIYTFTW